MAGAEPAGSGISSPLRLTGAAPAGALQHSPWPLAGLPPAHAEPPFRALGTGALGSAPGRGGAPGGGAARGRGSTRTAGRGPRTCTWKHSSRKWKHLRGGDGEVVSGTRERKARGQTDTQRGSQTAGRAGGRAEPRAHRLGGQPRARALTGKCRRRALNTSLGAGQAAAPSPACTCPLRAAGTGRLRRRRRRRRRCCCSLRAGCCCCCRLCCSGALRGAPCGISAPRGSSRALRPPGWRGGCGAAAAVQEAPGRCGDAGSQPAGRPSGRPRGAG